MSFPKEAIVGNFIIRNMAGIEMKLRITEVTEDKIICGSWEFDRLTGAEIDEDLGWGPQGTGSYISRFETE